MKLDKICRTCLLEKSPLKSVFGACLPNMMMNVASIQVLEGDGLPNQICIQCLQMVNRAYTFKQQCEKSDTTLREYMNKINLQTFNLNTEHGPFFGTNEVLQQTSLFTEIFGSDTTHSLVDNFAATTSNTVVSDFADTMQSLQTIAEQCLPETWDNDHIITGHSSSEDTTCNSLNLEPYVKCQFCELSYADEWSLAEHIKVHTGQALSKHTNLNSQILTDTISQNKKLSICNVCGKQYTDAISLKSHMKEAQHNQVKNVDKNYACSICDKRYAQNKFLVLHLRSHTGERPLHCNVCGKSFSLPSSLHKHRLVHIQDRKFSCTLCGKYFKQMSNLTAHMKSHTGEKSFICTVCGKACSTNTNLEIHMRLHTGKKPYQCSQCDSAFVTSSQLKKHFMRHTGEKPYKCWQCGKSFRKKDTRDTHVRYHTGERPFACQLCSKRYIAASDLRIHMKGHTGDRKYRCNVCPKAFIQARTLRVHLQTHNNEKMYLCSCCGNTFTTKGLLTKHKKLCYATI